MLTPPGSVLLLTTHLVSRTFSNINLPKGCSLLQVRATTSYVLAFSFVSSSAVFGIEKSFSIFSVRIEVVGFAFDIEAIEYQMQHWCPGAVKFEMGRAML